MFAIHLLPRMSPRDPALNVRRGASGAGKGHQEEEGKEKQSKSRRANLARMTEERARVCGVRVGGECPMWRRECACYAANLRAWSVPRWWMPYAPRRGRPAPEEATAVVTWGARL